MSSLGTTLRSLCEGREGDPADRPGKGEGAIPEEIQRLWLELDRADWKSLALVPVGPSGLGLDVAREVAAVAGIHAHRVLMVLDALALELKQVSGALEEMRGETDGDERVLVALSPLAENLACIPLARACDAVLLCVRLGASSLAEARQAVEIVGAQKVLGVAVV